MASSDDVRKLAALARLSIPDQEIEKFSKEFESILSYVSQVNVLSIPDDLKQLRPVIRNVFREDANPHESGLYTEKLAAQFPEREEDYLKVKKIISHD